MNYRTDLTVMGKNIAKYRKNKKLTQKKLGEIIDVSDKSISKWENGNIAPDITLLVPLAKTLDVSVQEILTGDKNENNIATVEGIKLYTKITKMKIIKYCIIIILLMFSIFLTYYIVNNKHKVHIYKIKTNDINYFVNGNIIQNMEGTKILIDKLTYLSENIGTLEEPEIKEIKLEIVNGNDTLISKNVNYNEQIPIHRAFQDLSIFCEFGSLNLDSLKLKIIYFEENSREVCYVIDLKI